MGLKIVKAVFIILCIFFIISIFLCFGILYLNSAPISIYEKDYTFIIKKGENLLRISNNLESKGLIRSALFLRVLSKIFNDFENMGCCDDHQIRNALRRRQSEKSSG